MLQLRLSNLVILLGLGLWAASALKLAGLDVSVGPSSVVFSQPEAQLATALWELLLGAWLLSGWSPRVAWLAALSTFVVFAAASGYLSWVGIASCGCFGVVQVSPWWAFLLDVLAIAVLLVSYPKDGPFSESRVLQGVGAWVGAVALLLIVLAPIGWLYFGSLRTLLAFLRDEGVTAAGRVELGTYRPGERVVAEVNLSKLARKESPGVRWHQRLYLPGGRRSSRRDRAGRVAHDPCSPPNS